MKYETLILSTMQINPSKIWKPSELEKAIGRSFWSQEARWAVWNLISQHKIELLPLFKLKLCSS